MKTPCQQLIYDLLSLPGVKAHACDDANYFVFCVNVKLWGLDLTFDNLLDVARQREYLEKHQDTRYFVNSKLWDWKYIKSRYDFHFENEPDCEDLIQECREAFLNQDFVLPNGKQIDCKWGFYGRNNGWLVLTEFEGITLNDPEILKSMTFHQLKRLKNLLVEYTKDLIAGKAETVVETTAALDLFSEAFDNACVRA